MLRKAPSLPADEVFCDLEDSVAPNEKEAARGNVIEALQANDWGDKTVVVRINAVDTSWAYRDIIEVVEGAGEYLDCLMIPKVQNAGEVEFVDHLLRMIEDAKGLDHRIGIEAQIENGPGLTLIDEIAFASDRLETLIFGPGDMAAALGMPSLTVGELVPGYPGDPWHWVHMRILVAARTAGLQAIDGPYAKIRDLDGYREVATRTQTLGYDGKWVLHPDQIVIANQVYAPTQAAYERAEEILAAHAKATDVDGTGAVMLDEEMIDEASRKMAEVTALRGRAAGLRVGRRAQPSPRPCSGRGARAQTLLAVLAGGEPVDQARGDVLRALLLAHAGVEDHDEPGQRRDDPLQDLELALGGGNAVRGRRGRGDGVLALEAAACGGVAGGVGLGLHELLAEDAGVGGRAERGRGHPGLQRGHLAHTLLTGDAAGVAADQLQAAQQVGHDRRQVDRRPAAPAGVAHPDAVLGIRHLLAGAIDPDRAHQGAAEPRGEADVVQRAGKRVRLRHRCVLIMGGTRDR